MKNKKVSVLVSLAATFLVAVCASIGVWVHSAGANETLGEPVLKGGEIEETYVLGEYLSIPSAQITCGDKTLDAKVIVKKPNGELVQTANVALSQGGIYTVEYRAVFDGTVKSVEKSFIVETPLFSASSKNTSAVYGMDVSQYQMDMKGVNVALAEGDILTYNDVIDLNESDGDFLEFILPPTEGPGTSDLRKLVITLTDLHNPAIALTVVVQCSAPSEDGDLWYYDYAYVLAGGQNQTPTGFEVGSGKTHVGNDWGCPTRFSFYGMHGQDVAVGTETLNLNYNAVENAVYANNTKVIKLDDPNSFDNAWGGFTTGEVKMTIQGGKYIRPFASMFITRIGVNNLNQVLLEDKEAPEITVDYAGLNGDSSPTAAQGYSYPVFQAKAMDKASGTLPVKTTVYYGYESSQRYQVAVVDGKFKTARTGYYTIEYTSTDGYGNVGREIIVVECKATSPAISVAAKGEYETTGKTGELFYPAEMEYHGGTGSVDTYATVKTAGGEEVKIDGGFRLEQAGTHTITLYAVDMLGKTASYSYDVQIDANEKPVFLDEAVMPKFFLSGYNYTLPTLSAYDYSNGKAEIPTAILVKDGGEERELTDGVGNFIADADGYATVIYKATGKQGVSTKEYKVRVINTWLAEKSLDMSKYFYGENITTTPQADHITVASTADTEYTFINPVIAHKLELRFAITQNEFSCVQLVFEDAEDASIGFTVEIDKASDETAETPLRINGTATRETPSASFYNGKTFIFTYNAVTGMLQEGAELKQAIKNADGTVFEGFPSKKVYVTARIIGVEGNAELSWKKIGSQILSDMDIDMIKPSISVENEYEASYAYNSVCEIYPAVSADVLSPETTDKVSVYDPSGKIVKDVNGLPLDGVPYTQSYFVKLEQYGSYSVVYSSKDVFGREQKNYCALFVSDELAPIISLQGELQTEVKVGEEMKIVKAIAVDNLDGDVAVYTYLVDPEGRLLKVENGGSYVPTKAGVYEIRYMTIDEFGNLRMLTRKITVV